MEGVAGMRYVGEYRDYNAIPISTVSTKAYEDVGYQTYHVSLVQQNLGGGGRTYSVGDKKKSVIVWMVNAPSGPLGEMGLLSN